MGTLTRSRPRRSEVPHGACTSPCNNSWTGYSGYIMQAVRDELRDDLPLHAGARSTPAGCTSSPRSTKPMMNALYATVKPEPMKH